MFQKKECVAMLLAGGQGSRLYTLTEKTAKPAVPFGGKYRIIDFTLSNCVNSGIDTVGVLTQYQPLQLNEYIGTGQPWDLDRNMGGVSVLPPYQGMKGADWYKGTANAIYQNLDFIDRYDPEYVLVLSGDHIYKMDYAAMLDFHKEKNADCTIAVLTVPMEEASRFGIMNTREDGEIYEFEEKPKQPKSDKASMGIYIFSYRKLRRYLIDDENTPGSSNDFGKNIIPNMLSAGERMFAYPFRGYWKDVGTISSLWEGNMDLLGDHPVFNLYDRSWRIFFRSTGNPPQYVGEDAKIRNSIITEGCEIYGTVENSVLFSGVYVAPGAVIRDSVVMNEVRVEAGATVDYSIISTNTAIGEGAVIGAPKAEGVGIAVVGEQLSVPAGTKIPAGEMVNAAKLDSLKG
ncbi:MAG: glucose-1-phosphate adenylyltransferase [Eubacteriales bacterium]